MGDYRRDNRSRERSYIGGRDSHRDFRGGSRDGGRFEMHKAICDECGKECEVPFKPSTDKPIYCSECFEKRGGNSRDGNNDRGRSSFGGRDSGRGDYRRDDRDRNRDSRSSFDRPRSDATSGGIFAKDNSNELKEVKDQIKEINTKIDQILRTITPRVEQNTDTSIKMGTDPKEEVKAKKPVAKKKKVAVKKAPKKE